MQPAPEDAVARRVDLAGLAAPVRLTDVTRYYREHRTPVSRRWWSIALIVAAYLTGQALFIAAYIPLAGLGAQTDRVVFGGVLVCTGAYAALLMGMIWRNAVRQVRIDRTARVNGLGYEDRAPAAAFDGSVLAVASRLQAADVVRSRDTSAWSVPFAAGTVGPIPGFTARRMAFVQLTLDRQVPHIVLLNHRSRVLASTGSRIRRDQRLGLEGDFDRTFTLFCPTGYERDALYVFTPDLMALLVDVAADCEVELLGDSLVMYLGSPWRLWQPRRFAALIALVDALGPKVQRQTARYRDDRSPAASGGVAVEGRRLRARPSAGTVLSLAAPVLFVALGVLSLTGVI